MPDAPCTIAVLATLDTKGGEASYLVDRIVRDWGCRAFVIDLGIGEPALDGSWLPDVSRREVANAGGEKIEQLVQAADRKRAIAAMSAGAEEVVRRSYGHGSFDAIVGLGDRSGTAMATTAMRALPLGVPKVMVSTMAGGDASGYVGVMDIVMVPSIVDIDGINRISRQILSRTAAAVCAMARVQTTGGDDRPLIAVSTFRSATPYVDACRRQLETEGLEVLVFDATGAGGRTMESLIEAGFVRGVLDLTTTECADELVGGVRTAGPSRLEAAAKSGTPAVVVPGCLDMVSFFARDTVPAEFEGRTFHHQSDNMTLMRTSPKECAELGQVLASKLNASTGPVEVAARRRFRPRRSRRTVPRPGRRRRPVLRPAQESEAGGASHRDQREHQRPPFLLRRQRRHAAAGAGRKLVDVVLGLLVLMVPAAGPALAAASDPAAIERGAAIYRGGTCPVCHHWEGQGNRPSVANRSLLRQTVRLSTLQAK